MTKPSDKPILNEQTIAASEERFRALVTATADIVYRMSPDWQVMWQLDGRDFLSDTHEPISDWLTKYIHPLEQGKVKAAIDEAVKGKKIFQLEHRVLQADGTMGWTFSRAVPIKDDNGEIIEWFGAASDITDRKRAEEALREAKEQSEQQKRLYETITSGTPDLIYVFDLNYRFTYANQALLSMWGKTWDTAVGRGLLENGYEPWHAEMHEREIDQIRATKQPIRGEVSFPHATLGKRIYDYILTPVVSEQGEVEAVAGTTRDITDIRNAEAAIAESEARFRTMAEGTNIYIGMADETSNAIYFNQAWTNLTGRSADDLVAYGWLDLVHPDDKERYLKLYLDAFKIKAPIHGDFRILNAEGQYRWLLADGSARFFADGSFAGYISASIDITELKEDEQRKNDFIGMVSHELKTPLTSLTAILQVANQKLKASEDGFLAEAMDKANIQVKRMSSMINGFLNISRLESGKILIEKQHFDLDQLVREMIAEARFTANSHNIQLEPCSQVFIDADRDKIGSVISNLINNAVKYSPKGKQVYIECKTIGDQAVISVRDEGMGVKPQDIDKIFDRYYRVKTPHTKHISGFGIGLYLSAEIVRRHDGKIWVESKSGEGSAFYFSLPLPVTGNQ